MGSDSFEELALGAPKCKRCGKSASNRCGACKEVWYCSDRCQRKHWKEHKLECKGRKRSKGPVVSAAGHEVLDVPSVSGGPGSLSAGDTVRLSKGAARVQEAPAEVSRPSAVSVSEAGAGGGEPAGLCDTTEVALVCETGTTGSPALQPLAEMPRESHSAVSGIDTMDDVD
ncbi:hypothetical protein KIPB_000428 [Kipferlia bialata]|uniref:MYND-type domain-containing protein n=1 Tax=Kipferlia bialata TaxID=797122 RepID=A0A9K3GEH3_9EUKA|nr:hypothetical protein KIPB_000428 [Kipferlia bialata]|eukprot:g428.t1